MKNILNSKTKKTNILSSILKTMFKNFFEELQTELTGMGTTVRIGLPHEGKGSEEADSGLENEVKIYLTLVNIESIDRLTNYARIRVLFTAFIEKEDLGDEELQLDALDALDDIISFLSENKRTYNLIATPESMTNNIWSAFKIPLRPFLMYECPVNISQN